MPRVCFVLIYMQNGIVMMGRKGDKLVDAAGFKLLFNFIIQY